MISIAPLILNKDDPNFIDRLNKFGMTNLIERLAKELDAIKIPDEILDAAIKNPVELINNDYFARPCIYLIFFDEHSRLKLLYDQEFWLYQSHISAIPVYCYLPSLGSVPFKIKIEEVHGLNSSRPFNIVCLSEKWDKMIPELSAQLKEIAEKGSILYGEFYNDAQENVFAHNGNLFRLPYLRIFREDYSISVFYACLEYVLMILHSFVLIDTSIIMSSSNDKNIQQKFEKAIRSTKAKFTDGFLFKLLQDYKNILGSNSSANKILDAVIPANMVNELNKLFKVLDSDFRITNRTWMGFIESCIVLRNATKGHGVTYYLELESIKFVLHGVVEFTKVIRTSSLYFEFILNGELKPLDTPNFVYYSRINEFMKEWMNKSKLNLKLNESEKAYSLYPNILYHPNYDFFLFTGVSPSNSKWYYKNFTTGLYTEISPIINESELC